MNERIKELAEQVSLELFNDTAQHRLLKGFTEKFAELIVKECASIAYNAPGDGDFAAQCILFEFNIDNCRNEK